MHVLFSRIYGLYKGVGTHNKPVSQVVDASGQSHAQSSETKPEHKLHSYTEISVGKDGRQINGNQHTGETPVYSQGNEYRNISTGDNCHQINGNMAGEEAIRSFYGK